MRAAMASPVPVLPDVGSTIVPPGLSRPSCSAASTMRIATRSLIEPPGLKYSTLATSCGVSAAPMRERRTSGVSPTVSRIESLMSAVFVSAAAMCQDYTAGQVRSVRVTSSENDARKLAAERFGGRAAWLVGPALRIRAAADGTDPAPSVRARTLQAHEFVALCMYSSAEGGRIRSEAALIPPETGSSPSEQGALEDEVG